MTSPFDSPASTGEGIVWADHLGDLMIVEVEEFIEHFPTMHSRPGEKSPAVRAEITLLDGPDAGTVYSDQLVFPKVLVGALRSKPSGTKVLARLGQGSKKPGQNAPWIFLDAASNSDDVALASRHLSSKVTAPDIPF